MRNLCISSQCLELEDTKDYVIGRSETRGPDVMKSLESLTLIGLVGFISKRRALVMLRSEPT